MKSTIGNFFWLVLFSMIFSSCATMELLVKKPEVKFKDIKVVGFDLKNIELDVSYEMLNPYSFSFLLNSIHYVFSIDGKSFLNTKLVLNKEVAANQVSQQTMRVQLSYMSIGHIFSEILAKRKILANLDGAIEVGFPKELSVPEQINLPFNFSKEILVGTK